MFLFYIWFCHTCINTLLKWKSVQAKQFELYFWAYYSDKVPGNGIFVIVVSPQVYIVYYILYEENQGHYIGVNFRE